jgi:hypothetical protein
VDIEDDAATAGGTRGRHLDVEADTVAFVRTVTGTGLREARVDDRGSIAPGVGHRVRGVAAVGIGWIRAGSVATTDDYDEQHEAKHARGVCKSRARANPLVRRVSGGR